MAACLPWFFIELVCWENCSACVTAFVLRLSLVVMKWILLFSFCVQLVSHSVGAHTESLQPRDDNSSNRSSSEDEDEDTQAPVPAATTSWASESATAAAAITSDDCCEVCLVRHVLSSHWCRADMRGSVKRVLCVCQLESWPTLSAARRNN